MEYTKLGKADTEVSRFSRITAKAGSQPYQLSIVPGCTEGMFGANPIGHSLFWLWMKHNCKRGCKQVLWHCEPVRVPARNARLLQSLCLYIFR